MKSVSHSYRSGSAPLQSPASRVLPKFRKSARPVAFRSSVARDFAVLLEADPSVIEWSCSGVVLVSGTDTHQPDFLVITRNGESCLVSVSRRMEPLPPWVSVEAAKMGHLHRCEAHAEFAEGCRLRNAKDLLRYSSHQCSLGDRVRLLAALDDLGSLTVAECLPAFQEGRPVAGLASLILCGLVEVDLDEALIGPETQVRRIRDWN